MLSRKQKENAIAKRISPSDKKGRGVNRVIMLTGNLAKSLDLPSYTTMKMIDFTDSQIDTLYQRLYGKVASSEILRNLEMRVARLEKQSSPSLEKKLRGLVDHVGRTQTKGLETITVLEGDNLDSLDGLDYEEAKDSFVDAIEEILGEEIELFYQGRGVWHLHQETPSLGRVARLEKQSSSSRFAQESFKRGDLVMLLTVKPGQAGSYANPGIVESVMGDDVRVSVGMASLIVPVEILVKATGNKRKDVQIWQENH